jgi:hypothetical protein
MLSLKSAVFTLEHQVGATTLLPGLEMTRVEGLVDIPDRFSLTVEAELEFPRSFVQLDVLSIEDKAYMTDILTREWIEVPPQSLPITFGDLGVTLSGIIDAMQEPSLIGEENINGVGAYHMRGLVQSDDLASLVSGAGQGFGVRLDVWLDRTENLLLQALITGQVVPTDVLETARLLVLDDIDVPVRIRPPE